MMYLLDTNAWVDFLHQDHPSVIARLHATDPDDVWLSSIVLAELRYGADKSQQRARNHAVLDRLAEEAPLLEFDEAAAHGLRSIESSPGAPR